MVMNGIRQLQVMLDGVDAHVRPYALCPTQDHVMRCNERYIGFEKCDTVIIALLKV